MRSYEMTGAGPAAKAWVDHYGECGVCVTESEALMFRDGVEHYCRQGSRLRVLAVAEADRLARTRSADIAPKEEG